MLIEFSVENFRSFGERQTLSMAASKSAELMESNCIDVPPEVGPKLIRSAVIYGPNASGKSNLLRAMDFMKNFVVESARGQPGERIRTTPFLLAREFSQKPSRFEVQFIEGNVRYQYGFAATATDVTGEWLFAYPAGKAQKWFERTVVDQTTKWSFNRRFSVRQTKTWREATRNNALLLSTAVQLNASEFSDVFKWFQGRLRMIAPAEFSSDFTSRQCAAAEWKSAVQTFLEEADLGIADFSIHKEKFDRKRLPPRWPEELRTLMEESMKDTERMSPRFLHRAPDGTEAELPFDEESGGTKKLFYLAGPWIHTLMEGFVLCLDEMDTSLHPLLMRNLLALFHVPLKETTNAQLIFSTHDTTILDPALLRRDQVWFVEKDVSLQSRLYPLTDFSPRKGERFEKGYLEGRYGALPFVGEHRFG